MIRPEFSNDEVNWPLPYHFVVDTLSAAATQAALGSSAKTDDLAVVV